MRVVFLEDVEGVARGGDVKEVKNGFARNYLIPKSLAVPATHDALQRVRKLAEQAEKTRIKRLSDMRALGEELSGARVSVGMRAGSGGRLYGSVTAAMVASRLGEITGRDIDRRWVTLPESVRELGEHEASVRLHAEVRAEVTVLVHPQDVDPDEYLERLAAAERGEAPAGDDEPGDGAQDAWDGAGDAQDADAGPEPAAEVEPATDADAREQEAGP